MPQDDPTAATSPIVNQVSDSLNTVPLVQADNTRGNFVDNTGSPLIMANWLAPVQSPVNDHVATNDSSQSDASHSNQLADMTSAQAELCAISSAWADAAATNDGEWKEVKRKKSASQKIQTHLIKASLAATTQTRLS